MSVCGGRRSGALGHLQRHGILEAEPCQDDAVRLWPQLTGRSAAAEDSWDMTSGSSSYIQAQAMQEASAPSTAWFCRPGISLSPDGQQVRSLGVPGATDFNIFLHKHAWGHGQKQVRGTPRSRASRGVCPLLMGGLIRAHFC